MTGPPPQMRLHNSLTRRAEPLEPITPGLVTIYTCGSTVYRYAHIGNLRTYLFADILRRTLEYLGLEVRYVKNITDVGHMTEDTFGTGEDRMVLAAEVEGRAPEEIAEFYTQAWLDDERLLNMPIADVMPRATDHIPEMIALTEKLLANGLAYEVGGNVYFDVRAFPAYGRFVNARVEFAQPGYRGPVAEDKRHPEDFSLWKAAGHHRLMHWASPWGDGFPGWHIECSAMSIKYLGERFDIHTGGIDLKFPHHEDEIAQSEGALGHQVVTTWLHGEFLTLKDAKMAKSAGNVIRVSDLPSKGFDPLDFRYLALTAHYRSKIDFTEDAMHAARSGLARLRRAASAAEAPVDLSTEPMRTYRARFTDAITDDMAMPRAIAAAHEVAGAADLTDPQRRALLLDFDRVLGVGLGSAQTEAAPLPEGAAALLSRRASARKARDFTASDALRDELAALGVDVRDTPEGQVTTVRR